MPKTNHAVTAQSLPIDKIKSSPFQARKIFDEDPLKDLAQSMKEEGLIQPIIVRTVSSPMSNVSSQDLGRETRDSEQTYELIAGERRLRAAKLIGWTEIDAIIRNNVNDQDAAIDGLIENLQRVDLNPLERAQGYQQLADMGFTQDQIAQKVGVRDRDTVYRYLALLGLPPEIQSMLPRGSITETHTRSIRQISDKAQQIKLAQQADKEGWSVKETEKRVKQMLGKPSPNLAKTSGESPDVWRPLPKGRGPTAVGLPPMGEGGQRPDEGSPPDPLAKHWPQLQVITKSQFLGSWKAEYKEGTWGLWITPKVLDTPEADLGRLFTCLGQMLTIQVEAQVDGAPRTAEPPATPAAAPPTPATKPPAVPRVEEGMDPKLAAMIARRKAKRVL